ncbi:MAG: NADH-quinone oxidoreductase subunit NuoE [Chloroflexi bacterium]|jgi:NADH-quinone oxidoreductase subunit E|nr:NADH-quinone oxidoreductase subunit NuoE [Chloroflexota bacterium]
MASQTEIADNVIEIVQSALEYYGEKEEELIPILAKVNRDLGFLPQEALEKISGVLKIPKSKVKSVASFYHMFSTKPLGRHVIKFCENAPCHVAGGREVWNALQEATDLQAGETSADGKWSLLTTSCLGLCAVGPVMTIDGDVFGNLTADMIPDILNRYE